MTLTINPVKLKRSIYFRVPIDIADLVGVQPESEVTLTLEERKDDFLLIYRVRKEPSQQLVQPKDSPKTQPAVIKAAIDEAPLPLSKSVTVR